MGPAPAIQAGLLARFSVMCALQDIMAQVAQVRTILLRSTLTTSLASSHLFSLSPACPNCQYGTCRDTLSGNGTCLCHSGWIIGSSVACDTCATGLFGSACTEVCPSCDNGTCNSGVTGNGQCTCATGWANNETNLLSVSNKLLFQRDLRGLRLELRDVQRNFINRLPFLHSELFVCPRGSISLPSLC